MHSDDKLSLRTVLSSHNPENEEKDMADKKKTGAEDVRWDLSFMYDGIDDPRLDRDVDKLERMAAEFKKEFEGRLSTSLAAALERYIEIDVLSNQVFVYLALLFSLDTRDEALKTKRQEVHERLSFAFGEGLTFFDLELVRLAEDDVDRQSRESELVRKHLPWIAHERIYRPHLLSTEVEEALGKRGPFGVGAWTQFCQESEANLRFRFEGDELDIEEILDIMNYDRDATRRAAALECMHETFGGAFHKLAAQTLNQAVGRKRLEDRDRKYPHPMASRNMSNRVTDEMVRDLHEAVREEAAPLMREVYRLKAAHLGLEKLRWSDRNAPMPFGDDSTVSWDEAVAIVLNGFDSFSPTLGGLVRQNIADRRIDAPQVTGKESGAFNMSTYLPGTGATAFTFLNYLGSSRDVATVAHELGHGVHGLLAGEAQGPLMMSAPTAYAETASTFAERAVFNDLMGRLQHDGNSQAMLALLMEKIDDFINTVVRQIGFSDFERFIHGMVDGEEARQASTDLGFEIGKPRRFSPEQMDAIWLYTAQRLYGQPGEIFTYENADRLWTYVVPSHFVRGFYVYGYSFGELLVQSLYEKSGELGDRFEPLYLDLLRSGGTRDVTQALAPFGLKFDRAFCSAGIDAGLRRPLEEAKRLSALMGIKID